MRRYNPKVIEPKWQKIWDETRIYEAKDSMSSEKSKPKKYILEYFPYPSGVAMHVGHVRNYTIGDVMARHSRMTGHNVLHPMGWDAFGLPAENFAIKNNISPRESTDKNIKTFKSQLRQVGFSYDWSREIDSSKPDYYQWTQWLFLQFYKKGLAYRANTMQNWCPTDKTVLANEQVINKNGVNVCERDGTPVTQKEVEQWFLKITDYADRLVDDLEDLDWPENIKAMQRNWIGRSVGAEIKFKTEDDQTIKVFTTRADTLFGATYMVLAPENPLVQKITTNEKRVEVEKYVKATANKTELDRKEAEKDKTGVFTGAYAINPASKEKIPIWIADYVLMSYGTGAIMAVPAHDERDHDFAKKYDLPITEVIAQQVIYEDIHKAKTGVETLERDVVDAIVKNKKGEFLLIVENEDNIHFVGGGIEPSESVEDAVSREVSEESGYIDISQIKEVSSTIGSYGYRAYKKKNQKTLGKFYEVTLASDKKVKSEVDKGQHTIRWVTKNEVENLITWEAHLIAWRQYLSGSTIYEGEGPLINSGKYSGMNSAEAREKMAKDFGKEQTQYRLRDWTVSRQRYWGCPIPIIYCDKDGIVPVPEEDLPVRLPDIVKFKPTGQSPLKDLPEFVNVKCPKCGGEAQRETDTFDTFIDSSWYFLRFCDPQNDKKPFDRELVERWMPVDSYIGGAEHAVVHLLYARFWTKFLTDAGLISANEPFIALRNHGMIGGADGRKMGKRYGNVVTPDELIDQGYGADALRLYELFIGPYDQGVDWNPRGIAGTYRFLDRVWTLVFEFLETKKPAEGHNAELEVQIQRVVHKTSKRVTLDLEELGFNTAIAALMECVNELYKIKSKHNFALAPDVWRDGLIALVQLLAPFAPHITEELWEELGQAGSVHVSKWPVWDESLITEEVLTLAVQVNGRLRGEIMVSADVSEEQAIEAAKKDDKVAKAIAGNKIKKAIYVPSRLINFVI